MNSDLNASSPVTVTFFNDFSATTKREETVPLHTLCELMATTSALSKASLPWLKLARFGNTPTAHLSLRHNGNVIEIFGIEGDYDGEAMSFEQAVQIALSASLCCIICTSPSNTVAAPRWRILAFLSRPYGPALRDKFMARLNGLFKNIFSRESWTLSQAYYFGSIGNNPDHRSQLFVGAPIDLLDDLDDIAIGRPEKAKPSANGQHEPASHPDNISDARVNGVVASLLDNIHAAQDQQKHYTLWDNALALGGYLHLTNWTDEQAVEECIAALPSANDWNLARRTAAEAIAKGRSRPLTLEDRPEYASRRRPPEPPPEWEAQHPALEPQDRPRPTGQAGNGATPEPPPVDAARDTDAGPDGEVPPPEQPAPPDTDHTDDTLRDIDQLGPDLTRKAIVALFNKRYAVAYEGSKTGVMWSVLDPLLKRDFIERASFEDFKKLFSNRRLTVSVIGPNGKPRQVTKSFAEWWLEDQKRRQYLGGVTFAPGAGPIPHTFNLWRGWSVEPTPGDWSLMAAHIHEVICAGRTEVSSYLIRWLAYMVQHPGEPGEVAIVVRGLKGVGKTIFGKWLLRLCGQHGLHIHNPVHLTGRFTGHLRDVIFVLADEAFFAGDKEHERILKGVITDDQLLIEPKYRAAAPAANMLHLIMFSNEDWVIPATHDERRYLMMQAAADRKGDFAYFTALEAQMASGGLAAMLHDLLTMDLGDFHPRRSVPDTPELAEQKLHSLDSVHRWWMAVLSRGFVWKSRYGHSDFLQWDEFVTTELLNRSYGQWCQENRINYPAHRELLGKRIATIYPSGRPRTAYPVYEADSVDHDEPQPVVNLPNQHGYKVGSLANARTLFNTAIGRAADTSEWDAPLPC